MTIESDAPERRSRADARDNHARLLQASRAVFEEQGPAASLNEVARRAHVGPGTLYRHFPNLQAILAVLIRDDVDALAATGRELLSHPVPAEAVQIWLRAVALEATSMKGLVATQLASPTIDESASLSAIYDDLVATGAGLVERAQQHGGFASTTNIGDLLKLTIAIAWASVQRPTDSGLLDRLMAMAIDPSLPRTVVFPAGPTTVLPTRPSKGLWRRHNRDHDTDPS